jgi:hypothetical protein
MKSLVNLTLPSLLISLVGIESSTDAIAQTPSSFAVASPANGASVTSPFQIQLSVGSSWVNVAGFQGYKNVCPDVTPSGGTATLTCTVPSGSQTLDIAAFNVPKGTPCSPGSSCRTDLSLSVNVGTASQPTASLSANPTSITSGQSSTLTWSCGNSTTSSGTGFSTGGALSGAATVTPSATASYDVTCTGTGGTATAVTTVGVSSSSSSSSGGGGKQAYQANTFLNSLGIHIHAYDGISQSNIVTMAKYAGWRWFRGGCDTESSSPSWTIGIAQATGMQAECGLLTQSGITDSWLTGTFLKDAATVAQAKIPAGLPNAGLPVLNFLELSNEPQNFSFTYNGSTCGGGGGNPPANWAACGALAAALWKHIQANSTLAGYPLASYSINGGENPDVPTQFPIPSSGAYSGQQMWNLANEHNYYQDSGTWANNAGWYATTPYCGF